ncbi:MAG: hypothetical protein KKC96_02605 [Nanoarchaeota archaeon]|nr:hypothetical protein [Nanoarchaeota archaeon]
MEKIYSHFGDSKILFTKKDLTKIGRMKGEVNVVSTVCPDYSNTGASYTFNGKLGRGVGLVAKRHLEFAPIFLDELKKVDFDPHYLILTADLPELVDCQKGFYLKVADSKEDYLSRCRSSSEEISKNVSSFGKSKTFSAFYGGQGIDYLNIQENVAKNIEMRAQKDRDFRGRFNYFMRERKDLAEKFRGRSLSDSELEAAAAHGMSLYVTHGTLLKRFFEKENLIVLNHATANLKNFFMCEFVGGYEYLKDSMNFPIGIIPGDFY